MAYNLETNRRPPPISTPSPDDRNSLLYDLPSAASITSPTRSRPSRITSPTSVSPSGRKRFKSPPPSAPSRVAQQDLEIFAEQCRAWYYDQNEEAGGQMTRTLATIPPSQRPPFAKLQASIRSGYHASVSARRHAEYQAHISSTAPGGSLSAHCRLDPNGPAARKERYERFEAFVGTWCTQGMPGTEPFFQALWAVMRLQVLPIKLGGAGPRRIDWEIDDAVFKEAAGKEFMLEAIDILKGVLAFEEVMAPLSRSSSISASHPAASAHTRAQSQPLKTHTIVPMTFSKRPRAPSDPFLDAPTPPLSRSLATTSSMSSNNQASEAGDDRSVNINQPDDEVFLSEPSRRNKDPFSEAESQLRIWTAPDITNPEYLALTKLFPAHISGRTLPRFPIPSKPAQRRDIEEGGEDSNESRPLVRCGTGTIMLGVSERLSNWQGGWLTRFFLWWRRLFC